MAIEAEIRQEIEKMPVEPLLPIEKQLIAWSLGLGVALLVILGVLSRVLV
jgi:hypothetical protein